MLDTDLQEAALIVVEDACLKMRGTKFILSKRYYEYVGKKGEYTRKKGLDKEANKLLIIEHLKNYEKGYIKDFVEA